ncbi:MAG: hypothetical protein SVC26_08795 [Pseudomonadota bacterium]|nr:hypothetical protein [Pseudomonadota bacterium]
MTKSLEVKIDGEVVGVFVPPDENCIGVMLGNVPIAYMRCQIASGNDAESWYWQLPGIQEGQEISFKLIEATAEDGVPPARIEAKDPEQVAERKAAAREAYKKAMSERGNT